eukprot:TRINITY_DN120922_c0_g1_i1.p1 TRINITY_DN120922_c0_g1~~TRINITY_DN120922_c0_g1_i1.p1  ORF type:complete len:523 (-),score=129.98 TRINITY_DN120922_c0_g1_i1:152-1720(-)
MARNMCFAAQQVLNDRDRALRGGRNFSPVALTGKQDQTRDGGNTTRSNKTSIELWKLKNLQPHLFNRQPGQSSETGRKYPPGFEETGTPGWLFNYERQLLLEEQTQKMYWIDGPSGQQREAHEGVDFSTVVTLKGAAAANAEKSQGHQAKHVAIMDFHKAAEAFKIDFAHIDRPAAMLAVYGNAEGAVPAEVAAKSLHEKLLRKLGAWRSKWADPDLEAAVSEALSSIAATDAAEGHAGGVVSAVALQLGCRLVLGAAGGAACHVGEPLPKGPAVVATLASELTGGSPASSSTSPADGTPRSLASKCVDLSGCKSAMILLATSSMNEADREIALLQTAKGRPRAGATSLLRRQPDDKATCSRAAASLQLVNCLTEESGSEGSASKRRRTGDADERVRCRRILLKYVGCKQPSDQVRRKPVKRSQGAAAEELLPVLTDVDAQGDAAFVKHCRALSECVSCLKGGDLVGDAGWWTRPVEKPGEKLSRDVAAKNAVIKTALQLEIGEVSDILVSDDGVQILQRRA